jgi:long-chain acyl-CoA synthetase
MSAGETLSVDSSARHLGMVFFQRVAELGERTFIKLQNQGRFEEISWKDFGAQVGKIILGLDSLKMRKGEMVAIVSENRLEWLFADLGTLAAGLPNVVLSPRISDVALLKILGHCAARTVFVEDEAGARRVLKLKGQLPLLVHVIVMDALRVPLAGVLSVATLLQMGEKQDPSRLAAILESVHPDDLATIIYTSGSTGEPKGVMRTQRNLVSNITSGGDIVLSKPDELVVLVLSLNHLLGRFGFHKGAATGRTTAVVEATELEVDLKTIKALAPTSLSLVPRVLETMCDAIISQGENRRNWEELEAWDRKKSARDSSGAAESERCDRLQKTLRAAFMDAFGGRVKYLSYGGAPMPPRLMHLFKLMKIPLLGSYGSTECGGVTLSGLGEVRPGNLGQPFPNTEVRIAEDGEILVRGATVTPGYFGDAQATREVLDVDGWFHTGDLGVIEADGSLLMIGRKKDVFYCSDGSNIYPGRIELSLESDPFIRHAVLVGDCRPFIAALLVPDKQRMATELGREIAMLSHAEMERLLRASLEGINMGLEENEKIKGFVILERDIPEKVRSVTAFQKIKIDRKATAELYRKEIESIYGNAAAVGTHQHLAPQFDE